MGIKNETNTTQKKNTDEADRFQLTCSCGKHFDFPAIKGITHEELAKYLKNHKAHNLSQAQGERSVESEPLCKT